MLFHIQFDIARQHLGNVNHDTPRIQRCLKQIIPSSAWANGSVGIAGSCALYWYMLCLPTLKIPLNWVPNDIDIFVCGTLGKTEKSFKSFVSECYERLDVFGYDYTIKVFYKNNYVVKNRKICIANIKIDGLPIEFSFIQAPCASTVNDVVDKFDIDIVQVMYNADNNNIHLLESVASHIKEGQAIVYPFKTSGHVPTVFERKKQQLTYQRMSKYERRSFTFINSPSIISFGYHVIID